jgi:peptidyl-prolyl cis-trans isomerase C
MRSKSAPLGVVLAMGALVTALAVAPHSLAASKPATSKPAAKPATAAPSAPKKSAPNYVNGARDTGQFLPDSFVILRVGPRKTNVRDYVAAYFNSYAEYRPSSDSSGRVQFLDNMLNKDILGLVALEANRPLSFEDRSQMREVEERALSNALYKSSVLDSLNITEDDLNLEYESYRYDVRLRHIVLPDSVFANRLRLDLVRGKITWSQAYGRYSLNKNKDAAADGDIGWKARVSFNVHEAHKIFPLGPGGISPPIEDVNGWNLLQVTDKRSATPPSLDAVRPMLTDQLNEERMIQRTEAIRGMLREQVGMVYDTTAINWASLQFMPTRNVTQGSTGATELEFNTSVPEFSMSDTARVLAHWDGGKMTLGRFMHLYTDIQPLMRPSINTPEALRNQIDGYALEPNMAKLARDRGLDKDSAVVATIATRREQMLVDHLYADSIQSRVTVDPRARRKYYDDHLAGFVTWAQVQFAALWAPSKGEADSLRARLKAGEKAAAIITADSLLGVNRGTVQVRLENEHGPYQKALFEMMRPGSIEIDGPDKEGHYVVLQEIAYIPGRQLSYDEASGMIDESLQNVESERLLNQFIARHSKRYPIEKHPDLVMRIRLKDPSL